jgi:hypothetical protein
MNQETHTYINWLERDQIVELLLLFGFDANDAQSTDELREALRENVKDGTIPKTAI